MKAKLRQQLSQQMREDMIHALGTAIASDVYWADTMGTAAEVLKHPHPEQHKQELRTTRLRIARMKTYVREFESQGTTKAN
jgi:hypothetical protein